ncbi:MAG: hypothetical protein IJR80_04565 [Treponema sp.]|nr:hypothetical protein [Treponema sp.]
MSKAGGALESIVINGRRFTCDAEDEPKFKLPGFENEVVANADGTYRQKKTRVPGTITDINIVTDDSRGDQQFIQETADNLDFVAISGTKVDGTLVSGSMQITDEKTLDGKANTMSISLAGDWKYL